MTTVSQILAADEQTPTTPTPTPSIFSLFSQTGKVALVTGAHSGIGLEIAVALAQAGAKRVYCLDIVETPSEEWWKIWDFISGVKNEDERERKRSKLQYIKGDVRDQQRMRGLVEDIVRSEGRIDVCVACAGIWAQGSCLDYEGGEFQEILDVNLKGVLYTAQAAAREMTRLDIGGSIILIGSICGAFAVKGRPWVGYSTAKAGVIQLAKSLASELGSKGIRVNAVSPGFIYTPMNKTIFSQHPERALELASLNPLNRLGTPDELRGVVLWLAGDGSRFCTGTNIFVDGGHSAW